MDLETYRIPAMIGAQFIGAVVAVLVSRWVWIALKAIYEWWKNR